MPAEGENRPAKKENKSNKTCLLKGKIGLLKGRIKGVKHACTITMRKLKGENRPLHWDNKR